MDSRKLIIRLLVWLFVTSVLTACSGAPPVPIDTISLPPYAKPLQAGSNPIADTVSNGFR